MATCKSHKVSPQAFSTFLSARCLQCILNDKMQHCQGDVILWAQKRRGIEKSLDHHFPSSQISRGIPRWTHAGFMKSPSPVNSPTKACHITETIVLRWNENWQVCVLCLTVCWNHIKHLRLYVSGADGGEVGLTDTSVSAVSACESSRQRKVFHLGFAKQRRSRLRVPHHVYHDSIVDTQDINGAILYYN